MTISAEIQFGDLGIAAVIKTVGIDISGGGSPGSVVVYSPSVSKIFVVYYLRLINITRLNDEGIVFKSASTEIGRGVVPQAVGTGAAFNGRLTLDDEGLPVFLGRAVGEDFVIDFDGVATAKGWAQMGEVRV